MHFLVDIDNIYRIHNDLAQVMICYIRGYKTFLKLSLTAVRLTLILCGTVRIGPFSPRPNGKDVKESMWMSLSRDINYMNRLNGSWNSFLFIPYLEEEFRY